MSIFINKHVLLVVGTILFFSNGFDFIHFPGGTPLGIAKFCILVFCGLVFLKKASAFEKKLLLLAFFIVLSCMHSIFIKEQNPYHLIVGSLGYFGLFSFFVLKKMHVPFYAVGKALQILMVMMVACYVFQWQVYPKIYFYSALDEESINEFHFRMRFACTALSYLAFFYGVNQFIVKKKKKYLLFTILGFIPMIVMGFRSLLALSLFFLVIMICFLLGKSKSLIKTLVVLATMLVVGLHVPLVQDKVDSMIERSENSQSFTNKDYVRNRALFFFSEYAVSQGPLYLICGGGKPLTNPEIGYESTNEYQKRMLWAENHRLFWVDLGLIGLAFIIGIPAVVLIVSLCFVCAFHCKSPELQFVRFTLLTLVFGTGITTMELFRTGNFYCIGLLFYYVYIYNCEYRNALSRG